ncbi:hypothetical protein BJ742DRAFT_818551 [Cladochytrium replicatum]|nr:hypothetical protein BJ742DRAFT_818551 [Cladochytrium replicatum]
MDSILELQRQAHEEIERLEQAIVKELMQKTKTVRRNFIFETNVIAIQEKSRYLLEVYKDDDGMRKSELSTLLSGSDVSEYSQSEFYERLKAVKDHHRRHPNEVVEPMDLQFTNRDLSRDEEAVENLFTGEENLGKFLDLHVHFEQYVNLKGVKELYYQKDKSKRINTGYIEYVSEFSRFDRVPKETRTSSEYSTYLRGLEEYLERFVARCQPLFNMIEFKERVSKTFEQTWGSGKVSGWEYEPDSDKSLSKLYCIPCQKQFAKDSVFAAHLDGKKHKKAQEVLDKSGVKLSASLVEQAKHAAVKEERDRTWKPIARMEYFIGEYYAMLISVRDDTVANVERKQAITDTERTKFAEEAEEIEVSESESEDEDKIYNPLKLPLGWDGKPIPYWLYKLHGLGVEYPCEICGNYVYAGRKAFDRHFQEWRHAHGMRCLGIPNTRHFQDITLIEDAFALWEKLKVQTKTESFRPDTMEEYEDKEGNVFNKKTYEDLKRQGLL